MNIKRTFRVGLVFVVLPLVGCATIDEQVGRVMMRLMDAKAPEDRPPNWETTKALMSRVPPKVGEEAPDFTLKTRDGSETVRLSQFEGDRPVVLIFGSWT